MCKIYHRKKGFPPSLSLPSGRYCLSCNRHARQEFYRDKYYNIGLLFPSMVFDFEEKYMVELYVAGGEIQKMTYRIPLTEQLDISFCINWLEKAIITIWLNENTDQHNNIDLSKYCRPKD